MRAFFRLSDNANTVVFRLFLLSAAFVVALRILSPFEVGWDQAIQLEAAHRLVQGSGLTSTFFSTPYPDLNQTPTPDYLTWFPPGFSLAVAALISIKLPLAVSLKIIYGITTMAGWFGWAIIGCHFLSKPIRLMKRSFPAHILIAAILPIFYTPKWSGTNIFLWAGVPFFFILLLYSVRQTSGGMAFVALSGLLSGLLFSLHFSSAFLAIAAFFILGKAKFPYIKSFMKNYAIFIFSSFLSIILIFRSASAGKILPDYASTGGLLNLSDVFYRILYNLSTISILLPLAAVLRLLRYVRKYAVINYAYGIICLGCIFLLPAIIIKAKRICVSSSRKDISVLLSFLPISLVILLIACMFVDPYNFLGTSRYYIPIIPIIIYIAYEITVLRNSPQIMKTVLSAFFFIFAAYNLLYQPSFLLTGKSPDLAQSVLGIRPVEYIHYPGNKIFSKNEYSRLALKRLQEADPEALFFVHNHPLYIYAGNHKLRPIYGSGFWKQAYLSEKTRIYLVSDTPYCNGIYATGDEEDEPIKELSSLPGIRRIFKDPYSKMEILVSDLPRGYRFSE